MRAWYILVTGKNNNQRWRCQKFNASWR